MPNGHRKSNARRQDSVPIGSILTNRALINAIRAGAGPLTRAQRIGLSMFGILGVLSGVLMVYDSLGIPLEVRNEPAVALTYVSSAAGFLVEVVVGCTTFLLGLRTLRHVIWKSGNRSQNR